MPARVGCIEIKIISRLNSTLAATNAARHKAGGSRFLRNRQPTRAYAALEVSGGRKRSFRGGLPGCRHRACICPALRLACEAAVTADASDERLLPIARREASYVVCSAHCAQSHTRRAGRRTPGSYGEGTEPMSSSSDSLLGSVPDRHMVAYSLALRRSTRRCVKGSTAMRPNFIAHPSAHSKLSTRDQW